MSSWWKRIIGGIRDGKPPAEPDRPAPIPEIPTPAPDDRLGKPKVGRNAPCPCGSGKKYKKCCLLKDEPSPTFQDAKEYVDKTWRVKDSGGLPVQECFVNPDWQESKRDVPCNADMGQVSGPLAHGFPDRYARDVAERKSVVGPPEAIPHGEPDPPRLAKARPGLGDKERGIRFEGADGSTA